MSGALRQRLTRFTQSAEEGLYHQTFPAKYDAVIEAEKWYADLIEKLVPEENLAARIAMVFNELVFNAYEHGSLEMDWEDKERLSYGDLYFRHLRELEKTIDRQIEVSVDLFHSGEGTTYLLTAITDEGEGFDPQSVKEAGSEVRIGGRGILLSKKTADEIRYNDRGNRVVFAFRIPTPPTF